MLRRIDVLALGLNAIVGSGIFLLPDDLFRQAGFLSPLAFLLCTLGLLPIALCFADASSRVTRSGGPYIYAAEAFGRSTGFLVGWMCFSNAAFSFAAVASAAAAYLARLAPGLSAMPMQKVVAIAIIGTFALLNYRGVRPGASVINLFTVSKFLVLLVLAGSLVPAAQLPSVAPAAWLPAGVGGLRQATFMALFALQGFEVVPVPAEETRDARRSLPAAILISMLAASLLYVVVQTLLVVSYENLAQPSDTPLSDAALAVAPGLAPWLVAGGLVSTLGFVSGSALGTPRYLYAMALDRHLPATLAVIHRRFAVPHRAVLLTGFIAALLVIPFDYRSLIGMSNVAVAVQYLATCLAAPILRARTDPPTAGKRFRPWIVPGLGALLSLWILTEASSAELLWAGVALAVGLGATSASRRTE